MRRTVVDLYFLFDSNKLHYESFAAYNSTTIQLDHDKPGECHNEERWEPAPPQTAPARLRHSERGRSCATMFTIVLLSQQQRCGKSLLACELAVAGERARLPTSLIDLSPNRAASQWAWRRQATSPIVVGASGDEFASVLTAVWEAGAAYAVVDTAPGDRAARNAARAADLVLIPTLGPDKPSTVGQSIEIARAVDTPAAVVFSCEPMRGVFVEQMRERLTSVGYRCAPTVICLRAVYEQAFAEGQTACEVNPDSAAAEDVERLFRWIHQMAFRIRSGPRPASDRLNRTGERSVQIVVPVDLVRRLEQLAFDGATTVQAIGREALQRFVARHDEVS